MTRAGLVVALVSCAASPAAEPVWQKAAPPLEDGLGPRSLCAAASDPERGGVLVFGGGSHGGSTLLNDTWLYDGIAWRRGPAPAPGLSPRIGAAMIHDAARQRHVLFGGFDGNWRNDTWELDASGWQRVATPVVPGVRAGHPMALDSRRGVAVVMGGYARGVWLGDVWEYDGATWRPGPEGPSRRTLAAMVDHRARGRVVLFGGYDGTSGTYHDDTWEYDGTWQLVSSPGGGPSPRSATSATYDPGRGVMVIFGGKDGGVLFDETWELGVGGWSAGARPAAGQDARVYGAIAYDARRRSIVLFGGYDYQWMLGDAWELSTEARDGIVAGAGPGPGNPGAVAAFSPFRVPVLSLVAYGTPGWGTTVSCGDIDGSGTAEILTGPGPGAEHAPHVRAFTAAGVPVGRASFYAYGTLRQGVEVAGGGVIDSLGADAILTGAGPGPPFGPHVRGFALLPGSVPLRGVSFLAYGPLGHGVVVAAGDVTGAGRAQILTAPGPGPALPAAVRGFAARGGAVTAIGSLSFDAFVPPGYGARIAAGDVDGDGRADTVAAGGPGSWRAARFVGWRYDGVMMARLPGLDVTAFPTLHGGRPGLAEIDLGPGEELLLAPGPDPAAGAPVDVYRWTLDAGAARASGIDAFPGASHGVNVAAGALGY